ELLQRLRRQLELERAQVPVELLLRSRSDDRRRHRRIAQQPRDRDVGRARAELAAERLVLLEPGAVALDRRLNAVARAPAARRLRERAPEQPARERAPGNHADAERAARRQDLELDRPLRQVVEALLAHEAEEAAPLGDAVRARDVPAREVAA